MQLLTVKTPDLRPGDIINRYAGEPAHERETVRAIEMPDPEIEPGCVVATVRTLTSFFWCGVDATHVINRPVV